MKERTGEKGGWIGGWIGSFLWLLLFGILRLYQGRTGQGLVAIGLFAAALVLIFRFAPWNNPETRYWKLLVPIYVVFLIALGSVVWAEGGPSTLGLPSWSILWLIPIFLPFLTIGNRRWND
ncbi:MAG: hypothetical protein HY914_00650 [Desulfomonile tiedjei]|nr:hypothetical protein [Desulfomonile tiedjei]